MHTDTHAPTYLPYLSPVCHLPSTHLLSTYYHLLSTYISINLSSASCHLSPVCLCLSKNSTKAGIPSQFSSAADAVGKELSHRDADMHVQTCKWVNLTVLACKGETTECEHKEGMNMATLPTSGFANKTPTPWSLQGAQLLTERENLGKLVTSH